jgi:hypothetical protein
MRSAIKITDVNIVNANGRQRISAYVDDELLWFDAPDSIQLEVRGEIFIALALLEAMISNLPIELADDIAISPTLLKQLEELQDIYCCWNSGLNKTTVQGGMLLPSTSHQAVGCFYSGGVDGAYSFCKHKAEVTHLITLAGFDIISSEESWHNLVLKNKTTAETMGVSLVDINNNFRQFSEKRKISIYFQHGLVLAGIAISLGFSKTYIPSSFTMDDLFPWGSHPITDPLWSIEQRRIVHDGAEISRSGKIKFIADYSNVLNNLQVCWGNIDHNCGTCSKCLRTRAALFLFGINCKSLKPLDDIQQLKNLTIGGKAGLPFIKDLMLLARQLGNNEMAKIFKIIIWRYLIRYHVEELVKIITGNKLKALVYKIRKAEWQSCRVTIEAKEKEQF